MTDADDTTAGYRPISCANYDVFEIAILHRNNLRLIWATGNILHDQVLTPVNLETRNAEEFLIARTTTGQTLRIRLDWIRKAQSP
ncbi:MAG: Rho-binding antiterminator [Acidiferrobacterales bacterium]